MKCYFCGEKADLFFIKNGYQLYHCAHCGLIFYDFKNDYAKFLEKQYSKGYFTGEVKLRSYSDYGKDESIIKKNMKWYLNKILEIKKQGRILDVGCAYGYFLELAKEKGFEVFGIDPSDYAVKHAKRKFGKRVQKSFLEVADFPSNYFDVITMFDVFEHLADPKKDLEKVYKMLKKNGILVMATGDTSSFWACFSGRKWTFYNPPQHIFYFNRDNVQKIVESSGLKVLEIIKSGKWLSLGYVLHLARSVGESKLADKIYPLIKGTFIAKIPLYLKLNDNMVIFAEKEK